jgi:nucleotidyltransferase/DNA polymerase involved in DNA repair
VTLFVAVHLPNLPIAVLRRDTPALQRQPVIVYGVRGRQLVVAAASDRRLPPGLPLRQARLRAPTARCVVADPARDQQAIAALQAVLASLSPRLLDRSALPAVTLVADLGRASLARAMLLATEIAARVTSATQLVPALGLGATPLLAHLAAQLTGVGTAFLVHPEQTVAFLAPQPVSLLPIAPALVERLRVFGLHTIGDLAALPKGALEAQFGREGRRLACLIQGDDPLPAAALPTAPHLTVGRRFAGPVADARLVTAALQQLAAALAARLQHGGWAARTLALTVELNDAPPQQLARTVATPTADARRLTATLDMLLAALPITCGIETLRVTAGDLVALQSQQLTLFAPIDGRTAQLQIALERLPPAHAATIVRAVLDQPQAPCLEQRVDYRPREGR